jgi:hypothetical protein
MDGETSRGNANHPAGWADRSTGRGRGRARSWHARAAALILAAALGGAAPAVLAGQAPFVPAQLVSVRGSRPAGPPHGLNGASCSTPAPDTASGFAAALDALPDDQWLAGDQALSVLLPGGGIVWLWGDTLRTNGFVHNSGILQTGGCLTVLKSGASELIPNLPDGTWYWPSSAVTRGRKLYVFVTHVRAAGGTNGFGPVGTDLAVFDVGLDGVPVFDRILPTPSSDAPQGQIHYGAAAAQGPDGYTYVYGSRFVSGAFGKAVYLARVPSVGLASLSAWRFWTGSGWSRDTSKAAQIVPPTPDGWSSSFSAFTDPSGGWVVLTKENEFLGRYLISATAPNPWGPWTVSDLVDISSSVDHYLYTPLAHPEEHLASGKVLVTVCNGGPDAISDPAHRYRPTFMELQP